MGLLNKIKNALFEEEEVEEIAKKIDVEKTIKEEPEIRIRHYDEEKVEEPVVKENKTPMIFDVEDFACEPVIEEPKIEYQKPVVKQEQKIIYGGYVQDAKEHEKAKFKPSPVISPVYGILEAKEADEYKFEQTRKSLDTMFTSETAKIANLDEIRKKAFGISENLPSEEPIEEERSLLYEMEDVNDKPGIEKLSIGDAVEYFEDLGLEYDVDYKDLAKEKMTRTKKNKELTEEVDEEIKEDKKIEKELLRKSVPEVHEEEVEEKNLYDLIDLMYDNKD